MTNKIALIRGDITLLEVDAIVNAANSSLLGGGGVDGAIHRAGGAQILEDCRAIRASQGLCPVGEAVITRAGNLKAMYVIHTVGPRGSGAEKLANCYRNSLHLAAINGCKTIAFPNISTGVYGYPKEAAAPIAISAVTDFLKTNDEIEKVIFCCFDEENFEIYRKFLA